MRGKLFLFGALIVGVLAVLSGCQLTTPEIRGVVLDAETKQPVRDAWIRASLDVKTLTGGGDVYSTLSVAPPHLRTDKNGGFVIPARHFGKTPPPLAFGTEPEYFTLGAETMDGRGGLFAANEAEIKSFLKKRKVNITIYIKPEELTEAQSFSGLQALYDYCLFGRAGVEVPPVKGGCDDWELDFAIKKHEFYLERFGDPKTSDERAYYFGISEQLADLCEKKGDLMCAITSLEKNIALIKKTGLLKHKTWQREKSRIESKIKALKAKQEGR